MWSVDSSTKTPRRKDPTTVTSLIHSLRLLPVLVLLASACEATNGGENCIADCDATSDPTGRGSTSSGGESGTTGDSVDTDSLECVEIQDAALAFWEANSSCETLLDCQAVRSDCFPPGVPAACTGIGLAKNADLQAWEVLNDQAFGECSTCVFEGDCGSFAICGPEQRCIQSQTGFPDELCELVDGDIESFLAENTACVEDEDCVGVPSCTAQDVCTSVAMNTSANLEDWDRLGEIFADGCDAYCEVTDACAAAVQCGASGFCELAP